MVLPETLALAFPNENLDYALNVTTVCFVDDV